MSFNRICFLTGSVMNWPGRNGSQIPVAAFRELAWR
jgi:hypothetical protein